LEKETERKDQSSKPDEKETQPAVNDNIIEEGCNNEEKQPTTKSIGTQDIPCDIKGVLVHVQVHLYDCHSSHAHTFPSFRVLCCLFL